MHTPRPVWVKLGSGEPFAESPLHPDERTSSDRADRSVLYHEATCAPEFCDGKAEVGARTQFLILARKNRVFTDARTLR
jgi:hypothetical protein